MYQCRCQIVPDDLLKRLASDPNLSQEVCKNADHSARLSRRFRELREQVKILSDFVLNTSTITTLNGRPEVTIFDSKNTQSLPGSQIKEPANSKDGTVKRTYTETEHLANFLLEVFKRNSIDNAGMSMMSSVHYGKNTTTRCGPDSKWYTAMATAKSSLTSLWVPM